MAANPNPARIPEPIWWLWEQFKAFEPIVQLGGIYANKSGYHNTRDANIKNWPNNYSYRDPIDKLGPGDKAAAIDLTFPDAQNKDYKTIKKYSNRLMAAGQARDPLMKKYLKEFFGQNDDDSGVEGWEFRRDGLSTSDSSHLWHIHISFTRAYVLEMDMAKAVLSVLTGGASSGGGDGDVIIIKYGDKSAEVTKWQNWGLSRGGSLPQYGADGGYGDETANMFKAVIGYGDGRTLSTGDVAFEEKDDNNGGGGAPVTDAHIAEVADSRISAATYSASSTTTTSVSATPAGK